MPVPNSFASATTSIPLSQLDQNFNTPITLGNTAIQLGNTVTTLNNMTLANATVSSGNVTVTSASLSGNLTFTGTGNRITGDFSNATVANRVAFQTSTPNGNTQLIALPNGTGQVAGLIAYANPDPTNTSLAAFQVVGPELRISANATGTGTIPFMALHTGGSERMRITSTGDVGIGTSSPAFKLDIVASANASLVSRVLNTNTGASTQSILQLGTGASAERYSNLNVNYTSQYFQNAGTNITTYYQDYDTQFFRNNAGTVRAMIDSSGNLLVGTTTSDARLRVNGTAVIGRFIADGGSYASDVLLLDTSGTAAGTGFDLIQANAGGAGQFRVRGDGTLFAQNTTVQSISDERVKENIRDSEEGLAVIAALRPVRFDFKEGFGNNRKNQLGFIAQEIEQVFADAVDVAAKEEDDDEATEPLKTVGAAALIPVLVKALQEQQQMIETLQAKVAALEGKK
jgi:hypothetical protein